MFTIRNTSVGVIAIGVAAAFTITVSASPASADDDSGGPSTTTSAQAYDTVNAVADAAPSIADQTSDDTVVTSNGTTVTADSGITTVVPSDGSPVSVSVEGAPAVSLDVTPKAVADSHVTDGISVYGDGHEAVAVQPVSGADGGGVRGLFVQNDSSAPSDHIVNIAVAGGGSLTLQADGSVAITGSDGTPAGTIAAPWAKDADGNAVPTSYAVDGTTLTQHVDTSNVTAWPVTSDPWWHPDFFGHVTWVHRPGNPGDTYEVFPTFWGRSMATFLRGEAWSEAQRKAGRPLNNSMYNQLMCHADWWPLKNVYGDAQADSLHNASSWNLDTWRPDVGYWTTVYDKCNPS